MCSFLRLNSVQAFTVFMTFDFIPHPADLHFFCIQKEEEQGISLTDWPFLASYQFNVFLSERIKNKMLISGCFEHELNMSSSLWEHMKQSMVVVNWHRALRLFYCVITVSLFP